MLRERRNRRLADEMPEPDDDGTSERPPHELADVATEYDENDDATDSQSSLSDSKVDDDLDF